MVNCASLGSEFFIVLMRKIAWRECFSFVHCVNVCEHYDQEKVDRLSLTLMFSKGPWSENYSDITSFPVWIFINSGNFWTFQQSNSASTILMNSNRFFLVVIFLYPTNTSFLKPWCSLVTLATLCLIHFSRLVRELLVIERTPNILHLFIGCPKGFSHGFRQWDNDKRY